MQNVDDLVKRVDDEEEMSIPLDISDILEICKEYSLLGFNIQNQVQNILENGVDECLLAGSVKENHLPHIKAFLHKIQQNPYFGDAGYQADMVIKKIDDFLKLKQKTTFN